MGHFLSHFLSLNLSLINIAYSLVRSPTKRNDWKNHPFYNLIVKIFFCLFNFEISGLFVFTYNSLSSLDLFLLFSFSLFLLFVFEYLRRTVCPSYILGLCNGGLDSGGGRLYRTGDLSTDNLTSIASGAGNGFGISGEWDDQEDDSWSKEDHDQTRVSVVRFQGDEEDLDEGREVSEVYGSGRRRTCFRDLFDFLILMWLLQQYNHITQQSSIFKRGCSILF